MASIAIAQTTQEAIANSETALPLPRRFAAVRSKKSAIVEELSLFLRAILGLSNF